MNRIALFIILAGINLQAQNLKVQDSISNTVVQGKFSYTQLVIPVILISYGAVGLENNKLRDINLGIREKVIENIDRKFTVDDFSQLAPAMSVYTLNALGVDGTHNFKDRTVIIATSYLIVTGAVLGLKHLTESERPDGDTHNSFPSGHTAIAFAGAEFLLQEYRDKSIWYGVAGYAVATGTGIFRILNNRHWVTDVTAGAGIGILSTKIAYWIKPYITRKIFGSKETRSGSMIVPFYNGREAGVCIYWSLDKPESNALK